MASSRMRQGWVGRCWLCLSRKCLHQSRDIFAPLAQRRHVHRDHLQAGRTGLRETALLGLRESDRRLVAAITRTSTLIVRSARPAGFLRPAGPVGA